MFWVNTTILATNVDETVNEVKYAFFLLLLLTLLGFSFGLNSYRGIVLPTKGNFTKTNINNTCELSPTGNSKWDIINTCFSSKRTFLVKSIRPLGSFATVTMFPCKIRKELTSDLVECTTIPFTIPKSNQEPYNKPSILFSAWMIHIFLISVIWEQIHEAILSICLRWLKTVSRTFQDVDFDGS